MTVEELVELGNPYHETVWGTTEDASSHRLPVAAGTSMSSRRMMRQLILRGVGAGFLPETIVAEDLGPVA